MSGFVHRSGLIGCALATILSQLACSSSSSAPNANGGAGQGGASETGGSSAQAGTFSNGGAPAQGGSAAQAGTTAQGGASGMAGAGGQAGSSGDACKQALLCDDFEKYNAGSPPSAPWASNMNGGTVTIDTAHVHSGTQAVKLSAAAATGYRSTMINLQKTSFLPPPGNVLYGRMMFWLDSAPQTSVHWTFIDGEGLVPGQAYHSVYRYGGQAPITDASQKFLGSQLMANYDTPDSYAKPPVGPSSDCWQHSDKTLVPVGAWACAEWKFDGAANKMQFWLNGTEITTLAMNGTGQGCVNPPGDQPWLAPSFERIDLGWESYQADDARTMWIDDVAISTEKIGCPP